MKTKKLRTLAALLLSTALLAHASLSQAYSSPHLNGQIEYGQTHVIKAEEDRLAPHLIGERSTVLLFTPENSLPEGGFLEVSGTIATGEVLPAIRMKPPSELYGMLEERVSGIPLEHYSKQAWSAMLPWHWIRPGLTLTISYSSINNDGKTSIQTQSIPVQDIGAPIDYNFSRVKIRAWDGKWYEHSDNSNDTIEASELVRDFYGSVPVSRMTIADYSPLFLDKMLISNNLGTVLVTSHEEMQATGKKYYSSVLKPLNNQGVLAANIGEGLIPSGISTIPRGDRTFIGMGKALKSDGNYYGMTDEGVYGGWHGWSAINWGGECGNGFIHEAGHSYNMAHFTSGTAQSWGISDEYPQDGVNLPSHPAGFHTAFRKFRTWYQVDANGPKKDGNDQLKGKKDPMNGGDSAYSGRYCFPQFTAYHSMKAQTFLESLDVVKETPDGAGLFRWDSATGEYVESTRKTIKPLATNTGVALVMATITYDGTQGVVLPVITSERGNLFDNPSPFDEDLDSAYNGSQFFFELDYLNRKEYLLIGKSVSESTSSFIASVNLSYNGDTHAPSSIKLYKAARGYPEIRLKDSVLLDERTVDYLAETPQARTVGGPYDGQLSTSVTSLCSFDCEDSDQTIRVTYAYEKGSTVFLPNSPTTDVLSQIHWTGKEGETLLDLRGHNESGNSITLKVKAIREVTLANGEKKRLPINDATEFPDQLEEAFVLWAPSGLNSEINQTSQLITSYWRENSFVAYNLINRKPVEEKEIDVRLDLWSTPAINADLSESDYIGLGYHELYPDKLSGTTIYYVTDNPKVGPVSGVWSGGPSYINISVPMVHEGTDETYQVSLRAQRRSHPYEGYWYAMNDAMWIGGSGGNAYPNHLRLSFHDTDNPSLPSGRYQTQPEHYLYIEGRAWHASHKLLGKHLFNLSVTAP